MEITANPLDWTSIDGDNLAKFLDTDTGRRLIPKLADASPPLFDKGDTNLILIRTGEVRGVQRMLREILDLAHPPPPTPQREDNHPPLEDDKYWTGPKLNDPDPKLL
jgi:hypothetical protein